MNDALKKLSDTEDTDKNKSKPVAKLPILQINRLNYVRLNVKILASTNTKLQAYLRYATESMATEITADDCLEYGLKMLFERDAGFRERLNRA